MGNDSDHQTKKKYLTKEEVLSTKGIENINDIYNIYKNTKGIITLTEFRNITKNLLTDSEYKKILKICGTNNTKFTEYDLMYFYAILTTNSFNAKLNFILDFIFTKKNTIPKEKYIRKVNKYYNKSEELYNILSNKDMINNKIQIEKNDVFNYIKNNFYNQVNEYKLYTEQKNKFNICQCFKEAFAENIYLPGINVSKINYLELEFKLIEKENDNIFKVDLLENMLKEININQSLIDVIGNYLRQKSQKNFINYELFEELLNLLKIPINNSKNDIDDKEKILDGLFKILSYPNEFINKTAFFIFMKSTKNELSSNKINKILADNNIQKIIYKKDFDILVNHIMPELIESFEHLKYLPYIYFNKELKDKKLEKNCIDILLNGKSLEEYIYNRIEYDKKFYIINKSFWDRWEVLIPDPISNGKDLKILKVNYSEISKDKILKEGLAYSKDYIILSNTMYKLFSKWYKFPNNYDIERERINISINQKNKKENQIDMLQIESSNLYNNKKFEEDELKTFQTSHEFKTNNMLQNKKMFINKNYEIEIFPVFLIFYKMEHIIKRGLKDMHTFKKILEEINKETKKCIYNKFSRKTKIRTIIEQMQDFFENKLTPNTARLWFYLNHKLDIIPYDDTLEKHGITNIAISIIEIKKNGVWQLDSLNLENHPPHGGVETTPLVGISNIENSCYMNSILQIFLNILEIKNFFLRFENEDNNNTGDNDDNEKEIFSQNLLQFIFKEHHKNNFLLKSFLNLLRDKWSGIKKTLNPQVFKEICGRYQTNFAGDEQQDAYDFYTFLLDTLHEETNIKLQKEKNDLTYNNITNEQDLANVYWANLIRNNASYFYALFMGQLQSKLICTECKFKKIKFEPFNALNLPIPENDKYIIKICLFRLPITLSPFFENFKPKGKERQKDIKSNSIKNKILNDKKIRKNLVKIKDNYIGIYSKYTNPASRNRNEEKILDRNNNDNNNNINDSKFQLTNKSDISQTINLNTEYYENELNINKNIKNEEDINSNPLMINIPLHLKIEIDKNKKCNDIIDILKGMKDLYLDEDELYTEFIILDDEYNIINGEQIINNVIFPLKEIYIYELLSYQGIQKVFGYNNVFNFGEIIKKLNAHSNSLNSAENKDDKENMDKKNDINKKENNINIISNRIITEQLIEIRHRYRKDVLEYDSELLNLDRFEYISILKDYIILTNYNSIKPYDLYELLWEKYMYYLNNPYDKYTWWVGYKMQKSMNDLYKPCSPFIIKIVLRNGRCPFCPWYKFCKGCILYPSDEKFINIESKEWIIIVEWCKEIAEKEMNKNNIILNLYHPSFNLLNSNDSKNDEKISIYDCLSLFTQKENINDIFCENCNKKTVFIKELKIERLPEYLFIVFKRFKYISKYSTKIESLISFPFEDLKLNDYMMQGNNNKRYDLFASINHIGSLHKGHYYCNLRQNNKWIKYDDSLVEEDDDINVSNTYILIYKVNKEFYYQNKNFFFNFNFVSVMDTAYKIYINQLNFDHIFNYIVNESGEILEEFENNCNYYYGEPVKIKDIEGYLINMYRNKKSEICAKIKTNNDIIETKIHGNDIKEIIKNDKGNRSYIDSLDNNEDEICSGCHIY